MMNQPQKMTLCKAVALILFFLFFTSPALAQSTPPPVMPTLHSPRSN